MKSIKKPLSLILALVTIISMFTILAVSSSAASTKTGRFTNKYSAPISIYTNGKAAKLRICTFNQNNQRTSGNIIVKAVSDDGATWTWKVKGCNGMLSSTTNITLPKGNTHYTVYIARNGLSNTNITRTYYFSVDIKKNCYSMY